MLNIDDLKNPVEQLGTMIRSGVAWYELDSGVALPGILDLDRLLHHEERHSEQWARGGYTKSLASYAGEKMTGRNETEEGAGLTDGGY